MRFHKPRRRKRYAIYGQAVLREYALNHLVRVLVTLFKEWRIPVQNLGKIGSESDKNATKIVSRIFGRNFEQKE